MPTGLKVSQDGQSVVTDHPGYNQIPLPVKPEHFALKEPISNDMWIMRDDLARQAGPGPSKLDPVISTRMVGSDIF